MPHLEFLIISVMPCLGLLGVGFWIFMLVHCLKNPKIQNWKTLWFLFIFFSQWVGAVVYFLMYVLPGSAFSRWFMTQVQSSHWSTPYYQPSRRQPPPQQQPVRPSNESYTYQPYNQGYQSYNAGYQAQTPQYPSYPPASAPVPQEEQTYSSADYEQPQTMYPELPPQQQ